MNKGTKLIIFLKIVNCIQLIDKFQLLKFIIYNYIVFGIFKLSDFWHNLLGYNVLE